MAAAVILAGCGGCLCLYQKSEGTDYRNDHLIGDSGDDILIGGAGADTLDGGDGVNTASYADAASQVSVYLDGRTGLNGDAQDDVLINIENLTGSAILTCCWVVIQIMS